MSDFMEIGGMLYERAAEEAYRRQDLIEEAAAWCKKNYPHKFEFLNALYFLLVAEERHFVKLGLSMALRSGAVKLQPVLAVLTPSQALRLLESYKRAIADDPKIWRTKKVEDMEKIESDQRRDKIVAEVKARLGHK